MFHWTEVVLGTLHCGVRVVYRALYVRRSVLRLQSTAVYVPGSRYSWMIKLKERLYSFALLQLWLAVQK